MIEASITQLVQSAPALDQQVIEKLVERLRTNGSPLALSIARVVELVGEGLVDPGIALPALASACATLVHTVERAIRGARTTKAPSVPRAPRSSSFTSIPTVRFRLCTVRRELPIGRCGIWSGP